MALPTQSHPPFAADIDAPLYVNDHMYVPKPHMEDERRKSWYYASLIPYTFARSVYAFLDPLPRCVKKPHMVKDFLPTYPD